MRVVRAGNNGAPTVITNLASSPVPVSGSVSISGDVSIGHTPHNTYTVAADVTTGVLAANTRKDVLSLEHAAATNDMRVRKITIGGFQTTALVGTVYAKVFKGSSPSTAGTVLTVFRPDTSTPSALTVAKSLPTIGTVAGHTITGTVGTLTAATAQTGFPSHTLYEWNDSMETQQLRLLSTNLESIVIAIYSNVAHNLQLQIMVEFTEE